MKRVSAARPVSVAALAVVLGAGPVLAAAPGPLEQARQAAEHTTFEGVLEVRWRDGDVVRTEQLGVQAAGGALVVHGATEVMARPAFARLVAHDGHGWEEVWLPTLAPARRPDGGAKYETTAPADGPDVAGRPSTVVEVHYRGRLLERIYLDRQTDLLLERDQFDADGTVLRTVAFQTLTLGAASPPPTEPGSAAHHAPKAVDATPGVAPPTLEVGYQRIGVYLDGGVLQALYSDGVYDLSVFQQPGRLRRSDLPPSGRRVRVGGASGWRYAWPGGQLVVWSAGGRVFTAVSDAPADQVMAAVNSLPEEPSRHLSFLAKVRRATQALMEPLS